MQAIAKFKLRVGVEIFVHLRWNLLLRVRIWILSWAFNNSSKYTSFGTSADSIHDLFTFLCAAEKCGGMHSKYMYPLISTGTGIPTKLRLSFRLSPWRIILSYSADILVFPFCDGADNK